MASYRRAKYIGPGYTFPRRRYHGPKWETRFMARALIEGWCLNDPDKQAGLVDDLHQIGSNPAERAADRIAAIKALMQHSIAVARLQHDEQHADQPKVIVVRRVDSGLALPAPEPDEGSAGEGPV